MGAQIIAPVTNDSPCSPVPFKVDCDFAVNTALTCYVAADHDAPTTVLPGDRLHHSTVATGRRGKQRVSVKNGSVELDFWVDVNIVDCPPPVEVENTAEEVTDDGFTVVRVRGRTKVAALPENPMVTCIIYLVKPDNTRKPVAIGFDLPDKKGKWSVNLKFKKVANKTYVARAFLTDYTDPFVVIAANSKVLD